MPRSKKRRLGKASKRKERRPSLRSVGSSILAAAVERQEILFPEVLREILSAMPEECKEDRVTDPIEAASPLAAVRLAIEGVGRRHAQAMGNYSWLFWLRRLPPEAFAGGLPTSSPYRRALAEVMSSWTTTSEHFGSEVYRSVVPAISGDQLDSLVKLCGAAHALAVVHSVIRRSGKGERVQWFRRDLPSTVPNSDLDEMIDLYDQRNLSQEGIHAGTRPFEFQSIFGPLKPPVKLEELALVVDALPQVTDIPYWRGPISEIKKVSLKPGRFVAGVMTTSDVQAIISLAKGVPPWQDTRLASLIILLRNTFLEMFLRGQGNEWNPLPSVGYLVYPSAILLASIQAHLPLVSTDLQKAMPQCVPIEATQVLQALASIETRVWPLAMGPISRVAGDQTCIDIYAATQRLHQMLAVSTSGGGSLVNARALHFEQYVQGEIDKTSWAPSPPLRSLWQKTLRINQQAITDLDAIAVHGSIILLVSCKSVVYTPEYECGDYGAVRNVRTHLEESDIEWQERVSRIRQDLKGDNYNLEGYEVYGTVCTPFVAFTYGQQARIILHLEDRILRAACSVSELAAFLSDESTSDKSKSDMGMPI